MYEEVREEIRTGDILACSGRTFYSKIIGKWGGFQNWLWNGKWKEDTVTHIGIAIWIRFPHEENLDRLCILEARVLKGVRLNPLSTVLDGYRKRGGTIGWQKIIDPEISGDDVAQSALKHWTRAYPSWKQFVMAGLKSLQWWYRRRGRSVDLNGNSFHCSELAARSLIDAGHKTDREPAVTTPQMLSEYSCLSQPILL
jgi:hypothetical protein